MFLISIVHESMDSTGYVGALLYKQGREGTNC